LKKEDAMNGTYGLIVVLGIAMAGGVSANTNALKNPVIQLGRPGSFEVVNKWNAKDPYIWCSAAKTARSLGVQTSGRLYVARAYGPSLTVSGEYGVVFTTRPDESLLARSGGASGVMSLRHVGSNISVAAGLRNCVKELDL
jgi:hypothetical protein